MSQWYDSGNAQLATGLDWTSADVRAIALNGYDSAPAGNNNFADTQPNVSTILGLAGVQEIGRTAAAIAGRTVVAGTDPSIQEFRAPQFTIPHTLGTNPDIQAILYYLHVGADSSNIPLCVIDDTGGGAGTMAITTNGADITVNAAVIGSQSRT